MLLSGVLSMGAPGVIKASDDTLVDPFFNGGTPIDETSNFVVGRLVDLYTQDVFNGGIGYDYDEERVVIDPVGAVINHAQGGMPMTANGLAVEVDGTPTVWLAGIPISLNGRVCISLP